jgi:hypothetical protein
MEMMVSWVGRWVGDYIDYRTMRERSERHLHIRESIAFIERIEMEAEEIRLELNHEIMFNLRDTYLTVARHQNALSLPHLAAFLGIADSNPSLEKMVMWNNHGNSLKYQLIITQFIFC